MTTATKNKSHTKKYLNLDFGFKKYPNAPTKVHTNMSQTIALNIIGVPIVDSINKKLIIVDKITKDKNNILLEIYFLILFIIFLPLFFLITITTQLYHFIYIISNKKA